MKKMTKKASIIVTWKGVKGSKYRSYQVRDAYGNRHHVGSSASAHRMVKSLNKSK